jgi:hypothetical protein
MNRVVPQSGLVFSEFVLVNRREEGVSVTSRICRPSICSTGTGCQEEHWRVRQEFEVPRSEFRMLLEPTEFADGYPTFGPRLSTRGGGKWRLKYHRHLACVP